MVINLSRAALIILFLLFASPVVSFSEVIINEIAWMGTKNSSNDEWIELYNTTDSPLTIDNWKIRAADGTPTINLSGIIPAKGFYLLERTNNDTVPNISADQIYAGALKNEGEILELYDGNNLIDSVQCIEGWFAGDNQSKQTMERVDLNDWQTSQNSGGTPKEENSVLNQEAQTPKEKENQQLELVNSYSEIIINEILPSPEGADTEEEWIEILNKNDFPADISGWQVTDVIGTVKTYTFPENTIMGANGFLVLYRPVTKITLNNSGDGIKIIKPNGEVEDEISFPKAPLGDSYNKTVSGWGWSKKLTPGSVNIIFNEIKETEKEAPKDNYETGEELSQGLADIGQVFSSGEKEDGSNYFLPILIALITAIASGTLILFFKKKIKAN